MCASLASQVAPGRFDTAIVKVKILCRYVDAQLPGVCRNRGIWSQSSSRSPKAVFVHQELAITKALLDQRQRLYLSPGLIGCVDGFAGQLQVAPENLMLFVKVKICRYVDAHFPGWVECSMVDARGHPHVFVDKVPAVTEAFLDQDSVLPQPGSYRLHRAWKARPSRRPPNCDWSSFACVQVGKPITAPGNSIVDRQSKDSPIHRCPTSWVVRTQMVCMTTILTLPRAIPCGTEAFLD